MMKCMGCPLSFLSKFKDSMRPLIEKDIAETEMVFKNHGS